MLASRPSSATLSARDMASLLIRYGAAFEIAARLRHTCELMEEAARAAVNGLTVVRGFGGIIAIDRGGAVTLPSTPLECIAYLREGGPIHTAIYDEAYWTGLP